MHRKMGWAVILGLTLVAAAASPVGANHPPGPPDKVTICHAPGTPDEETKTLPHQAALAHIQQHGDTAGPCTQDEIIDADGTATAGSGDPAARQVTPGTALDSFPVQNGIFSGLDMFNQDASSGNTGWTQGVDDLHSEDPQTCPGALRNGVHDLGVDCKVLDLNGDLADGEQVDCDLEVGFNFTGTVDPCPPTEVKYHDADGDDSWDNGEDLVFDVNNNGVFD